MDTAPLMTCRVEFIKCPLWHWSIVVVDLTLISDKVAPLYRPTSTLFWVVSNVLHLHSAHDWKVSAKIQKCLCSARQGWWCWESLLRPNWLNLSSWRVICSLLWWYNSTSYRPPNAWIPVHVDSIALTGLSSKASGPFPPDILCYLRSFLIEWSFRLRQGGILCGFVRVFIRVSS